MCFVFWGGEENKEVKPSGLKVQAKQTSLLNGNVVPSNIAFEVHRMSNFLSLGI